MIVKQCYAVSNVLQLDRLQYTAKNASLHALMYILYCLPDRSTKAFSDHEGVTNPLVGASFNASRANIPPMTGRAMNVIPG